MVPVDFLMFLAAGVAAYFLRVSPLVSRFRSVLFIVNLPFQRYFVLLLGVSIFGILIFAISGLYKITAQEKLYKEFFQIVVAISATVLLVIIYIFFGPGLFDSRFIVLAGWAFAIIFVTFGRFFVKKLQRYLVGKYDVGIHSVVIIGEDLITKKIVKEIKICYSRASCD